MLFDDSLDLGRKNLFTANIDHFRLAAENSYPVTVHFDPVAGANPAIDYLWIRCIQITQHGAGSLNP